MTIEPRTIRLWNSLPAEIAEINSLATFKSELHKYLVNLSLLDLLDLYLFFFFGSLWRS